MALAFDAATPFNAPGNGPHTWAHTCTGTDLVLLVFVSEQSKVSGITYNSVAMTSVGINSTDSTDSAVNGGCWYLINPDTGANNVVVTMSPNSNAQGLFAISYTGADQTDPIGASSGPANAHSTTVEDDITSTVANSMLVDRGIQYNDVNGFDPGGSQTSRGSTTSADFPLSAGVSERAAATVTTYTLNWGDADASTHVLHEIVELLPAVAAVAAPKRSSTLLTLGVG